MPTNGNEATEGGSADVNDGGRSAGASGQEGDGAGQLTKEVGNVQLARGRDHPDLGTAGSQNGCQGSDPLREADGDGDSARRGDHQCLASIGSGVGHAKADAGGGDEGEMVTRLVGELRDQVAHPIGGLGLARGVIGQGKGGREE